MTDTGIETMRDWARRLVEAADGGALAVYIVMPEDWGAVFDRYMGGDALACCLSEIMMQMTAGRRTAQGREPHLCACCRAPLKAPD